MPTARSKPVELSHRRQLVADRYVQGWTQTAIAQEMGVSQATICADLHAVQRHWRESAIRDFDAARELELQKLDRIEREAWEAWERSKQPAQSARVRSNGNGSERTEKTVRQRIGDPRFLDQIHKCIAARRALLGLDAPTRIAPVMPDGQTPFSLAVAQMDIGELRTLKKLRDRAEALTTVEQEGNADGSQGIPDH
jgi:hypothetical protein